MSGKGVVEGEREGENGVKRTREKGPREGDKAAMEETRRRG